jgi:hypothetical protein
MSSTSPVLGIRLPCAKDGYGYSEIQIPGDHPIFDEAILPVPARIGVPLVIYRMGTQSPDRADLDCRVATYLNVTYEDGIAPPAWQSHVGTCLVARKDKKPFSMQHMDAIEMYIDMLMDYFGDDGPYAAQRQITPEVFEKWFENYSANQKKDGRSGWENVPSFSEV